MNQYTTPTIRALSRICDKPALLKRVLSATSESALLALCDKAGIRATSDYLRRCYAHPRLHELKMEVANELCQTHGVEAIFRHSGDFWPAFEYLNAGDTYSTTLIRWCDGRSRRYVVGDWGSIVERGGYD